MKKEYLFTPGPTPIPTDALLSMARPIDYHRSSEAAKVIKEVSENLQHVFQTENDVLILTSSGTGAMEGAVANLLSSGDEVIVIRSGKFGQRWGEICDAYGIEFEPIDLEWGASIKPQQLKDKLKANTRAVFSTLCETSTGALHDIKALGDITKETETLLVVDAVSALGADDLQMDNWNVDVVVSCSQKGLMTPPGLAFACLSERAWKAVEASKLPKYYFDFSKAREYLTNASTPYTPAITLIIALQHSLRLICEEGIHNVIARHARLAKATRAAVKALGLQLFPAHPANTLTSVSVLSGCIPSRKTNVSVLSGCIPSRKTNVSVLSGCIPSRKTNVSVLSGCIPSRKTKIRFPEDINSKAFVNYMRREHGITYAGGQDKLSGKIIRIAHLGWVCQYDVIVAISALEMGLKEAGYPIQLGAGVTAAEQSIMSDIEPGN